MNFLSRFPISGLRVWLFILCSAACEYCLAAPSGQSAIDPASLTIYSLDAQLLSKAEEAVSRLKETEDFEDAFVVFCVQESDGKYLMEYKAGGRRPDLYDEYWNGKEACIYDRGARVMRVLKKPNEFVPGTCVRNHLDLGGRFATDLLKRTLRIARPAGVRVREQDSVVSIEVVKKDGAKLHLALLKVDDVYILQGLLSESADGSPLFKLDNFFSEKLASVDDIFAAWKKTEVRIRFDIATKEISSTRYTILSAKPASQIGEERFSPRALSLGQYIVKDYRLGDYRQYRSEKGPLPLKELEDLTRRAGQG